MSRIIDLGKLRFNFSGDWDVTTEYSPNDVVRYGGHLYVYIYGLKASGFNPNNPIYWQRMVEGFRFLGDFDVAAAYRVGDVVVHGSTLYLSILDGVGETPPSATYWTILNEGFRYRGDWVTGTQYLKNDTVRHGALVFVALVDTINQIPTSTPASWDLLVEGTRWTGPWTPSQVYLVGDLVSWGAQVYRAKLQHTASANTLSGNRPITTAVFDLFSDGVRSRGNWATTTQYFANDIVIRGNSVFIALSSHVSDNFLTDLGAGRWLRMVDGLRWRGDWLAEQDYEIFDVVYISGSSYVATVAHTSDDIFANDAANWDAVALGGESGVAAAIDTALSAWTVITNLDDGIDLVANRRYLVNTSTAAFSANLPANPLVGAFIEFIDRGGTFETNNLTLNRNGRNIKSQAENLLLDVNEAFVRLVYISPSAGWYVRT
jgi:hypothetical protein